jgi:hypothetical protein
MAAGALTLADTFIAYSSLGGGAGSGVTSKDTLAVCPSGNVAVTTTVLGEKYGGLFGCVGAVAVMVKFASSAPARMVTSLGT